MRNRWYKVIYRNLEKEKPYDGYTLVQAESRTEAELIFHNCNTNRKYEIIDIELKRSDKIS